MVYPNSSDSSAEDMPQTVSDSASLGKGIPLVILTVAATLIVVFGAMNIGRFFTSSANKKISALYDIQKDNTVLLRSLNEDRSHYEGMLASTNERIDKIMEDNKKIDACIAVIQGGGDCPPIGASSSSGSALSSSASSSDFR